MAAAAAAGLERPTLLSHNETMFNILSANISYNSFIQSNEVECADCVYSATYVAFWAIIDVNSPGVSRVCLLHSESRVSRTVCLGWSAVLSEHMRRRRRRRMMTLRSRPHIAVVEELTQLDLEKLLKMEILI